MIQGKVALVTGTTGIGRATAIALGAAGAKCSPADAMAEQLLR